MGLAAAPAGGPELQAASLSPELFEAAAMHIVNKDLMAMKVAELKEELEAGGDGVTCNKAWLQRRLHATIERASRRGRCIYCHTQRLIVFIP